MVKGGKKVVSTTPSHVIQSTMVKKVNVIARIPVRTLTPILHGTYLGITMSVANICKCLTFRAIVEEILPDGSVIFLDMNNYNKINRLEDPEVQKKIEEYRRSAVMGTKAQAYMTSSNIINHTAPLPRNHYLYSTKEKCDSDGFADSMDAMDQYKAQLKADAEESTTPPVRPGFPVVNTATQEVKQSETPVPEEGEEVSEDD